MIRLTYCLRRRPDLTLAAFQDYWRDRHAPLVARHAAVLGIRRYVQSHRLDDPRIDGLGAARGNGDDRYDGIAELWFDTVEAIRAAGDTAEGRAAAQALLDDEAAFIDLPRSPIFVIREHVVIE